VGEGEPGDGGSTAGRGPFRRVLLKLSGQALGGGGQSIDPERTHEMARHVRRVRERGVDLAIVVGGGNIFRGVAAAARGFDRATADYIGMIATVQNALALQDALEKEGVDTRVMSAIEIKAVCEPYIRRRALRHIDKGRVVICAAGTGNPYFSTDSAAALRALELGAEAILMAKREYDGVYDADPDKVPDARFIAQITHLEAIERGLKVMDTTALSLCMDNHVPILVFRMTGENIERVLDGERVGTIVSSPPVAEATTTERQGGL
jgi:uridylate kinase